MMMMHFSVSGDRGSVTARVPQLTGLATTSRSPDLRTPTPPPRPASRQPTSASRSNTDATHANGTSKSPRSQRAAPRSSASASAAASASVPENVPAPSRSSGMASSTSSNLNEVRLLNSSPVVARSYLDVSSPHSAINQIPQSNAHFEHAAQGSRARAASPAAGRQCAPRHRS